MTHTELLIAEAKARNAGDAALAEKYNRMRWEKAFNYRIAVDYGRFEDSPRYRADMIGAGRGRLLR